MVEIARKEAVGGMNAPMPYTELARSGGFTTDQVARLLDLKARSIAGWLRGAEPLIITDYLPVEHRPLISFEGLLEARVIGYLIDNGFTAARIRTLVKHLRKKTGLRHPLARRGAISTTGDRVFEKDGDRFVNLLNDCYADATLIRPALRGHVEYEGARALYLQPDPKVYPMVRVDPRRAFGRPVVVDDGVAVPTSTLADAAASEGHDEAADWYGVSAEAVRQAVEFEKRVA
jgi:uncharacterized protein (DUF433 family)